MTESAKSVLRGDPDVRTTTEDGTRDQSSFVLPSSESPEISTGKTSPLPWRVGPTKGIGQRGRLILVDADGLKVANFEADRFDGGLKFRRTLAGDTANVSFALLAVNSHADLVAALKGLVSEFDHAALVTIPASFDLRVVQHARAALAKAEGR